MGRFTYQYGLNKNFSKDTLFSAEKRLCFFASTPTPGTPSAPEAPDANAARIAELEAELAPLKANASRTGPENARMAGIEAELAALRTPPVAQTGAPTTPPPEAPDAETAGEQKTIDDLRKAAAEAETRSADPKPFYQQGHIPLDHLDTILTKMTDEKKTNPEIATFDEETIRVFHELKKDIGDYDFILDKIKNLDDAMAKVEEDKRDAFLQIMQKKAYAQRRLDGTTKKLEKTPAGPEHDRLVTEQKQFQDDLKAQENALAALNTQMKTGPVNPDDLERKAEEVRARMAEIGSKLGWDQEEWGKRQGLLWKTYKDYFTTLRDKVSQEREKALKTMVEKIDTVFIKRLTTEREKWEKCKLELEPKKAGALKMIDDALADLRTVQDFEKLPLSAREEKMQTWKELLDRTFKISQAQEDQFKRMIGKTWSAEEYDEAVKRRTHLHQNELARCEKLKTTGTLTPAQYDEAVHKENTFHDAQLKRFTHLRDHGWTQADCDEAIRMETEEQKRAISEKMGMDPLRMREMMAQSIKSHEQSTEIENASPEEQKKALGVEDDTFTKDLIELNDGYTKFAGIGSGLERDIQENIHSVQGEHGTWFKQLEDASTLVAKLKSPEQMSQSDKDSTLASFEASRQALTTADGGMPFVTALQNFEHSYNDAVATIGHDIERLKDPSLSPQQRKNLLEKVKEDLDTAKQAVEKFQKQLKANMQFFGSVLPGFASEVQSTIAARGKVRSIQWLDLNALHEIWSKAKEYVKHRYERKTKERIGIVGEKLFNYDLPILGRGLGQEFRGTKEAAERDAVETEKKNLTNADAWEIRHHMHQAGNKDVLKGMIELLADRGRLRFDDPFLWIQLNKYQKKVWFDIEHPSTEMVDYVRLEAKIQKAMGYIWEFEFFNNIKRNNDSKYASKKGEYEKKCDQIAEQPKGLGDELMRLLKEWDGDEAGQHAFHQHHDVHYAAAHNGAKGVDPHFYEEIIEYAIQKGKMTPEEKVFYLIQGVARGLISYDRITYFDSKYLNEYAIIEVFASETKRSRRPIMEDFRDWAKVITEQVSAGEPQEKQYTPGPKFQKWFWTYAMHQEKCIQRINKVLGSTGGVDHDDVTPLAPFVNEEVIDKLTVRQGNRPILPPTGLENVVVGLNNYVEVLALYKGDLAQGPGQSYTQMNRWIRSFIRYDAITDGRMYSKDSGGRERLRSAAKNEPRSNGYYHHGKQNWTVERYLKESRAIVYMVDEKLADAIFDSNEKLNTEAKRTAMLKYLSDTYGEHTIKKDPNGSGGTLPEVKDMDDFFKNVGAYVENIINFKGGATFIENEIFAKIRANLLNKNGDLVKPDLAMSFTAKKHGYDAKTKTDRETALARGDSADVALIMGDAPTEEAHGHH